MESTIKTYTQDVEIDDVKDFVDRKNIVYHQFVNEETLTFSFQISQGPEMSIYSHKEELYLRAIGNLLKKSDFLKLYIEVISGQITDEEYEAELTNNADQYFVEINPLRAHSEYFSLVSIIKKFPHRNLSVDDFSDIFGISHIDFCHALK